MGLVIPVAGAHYAVDFMNMILKSHQLITCQ